MLKKLLAGFVVIVGLFLAFVAMRPAHYHVERSVSIDAPAQVVYAQLDDLRKWAAWSPWDKIDPNMKKTYEGPERGVGASYSWQGNKDIGSGTMTIASAEPPKRITYKLAFREPMAGEAEATMIVADAGGSTQNVTWAMEGDNSFVGKMVGVFMDMDKMIGGQFESGLKQLKNIAEDEAKKQRAAEQAATAAAPVPEATELPEGQEP